MKADRPEYPYGLTAEQWEACTRASDRIWDLVMVFCNQRLVRREFAPTITTADIIASEMFLLFRDQELREKLQASVKAAWCSMCELPKSKCYGHREDEGLVCAVCGLKRDGLGCWCDAGSL